MRLIDADELAQGMIQISEKVNGAASILANRLAMLMKDDKFAPTIDAVPVVHAENVTPTHYSDEFVCGNCGFCCEITEIRHDDEDDFGMGEASACEYECKFCPNCGAKMDGGASDG